MASVFLGINDRTFTYESTAARAEHVGAGVRYPVDFAITQDDTAYIVNRGREDRPDGTRLTVFKLGEDGEEYISTFGSHGEGPGQFIWPMGIGDYQRPGIRYPESAFDNRRYPAPASPDLQQIAGLRHPVPHDLDMRTGPIKE